MTLLRTRDLVALLQANDPGGERVLQFVIPVDLPEATEDIRFFADASGVHLSMQYGRQTSEGDRNVLRVRFDEVED